MVQFMIKLIKYDKFNDISIRRILDKKIWNFPLPLATRITKEREKRNTKKEAYDFERKTNNSTAALKSRQEKIR